MLKIFMFTLIFAMAPLIPISEASAMGDSLCMKIKKSGQRLKCQCSTEYGGQAREQTNGKIRFTFPKGNGARMAISECQAKNYR